MTTDNLKIFSINYLINFIEKAKEKNSRINILTSAGVLEGKVLIVRRGNQNSFPEFISNMLDSYEEAFDIDDPFIGQQENTFIIMENATLKSSPNPIQLRNLVIYLDKIVGIAMAKKED